MTQALCFNCGHIKFGALLPCSACQAGPSGNMDLDVTFTDHYLAPSTLRQFGDLIQTLDAASPTPELRFWAFIGFVTEHHPAVLRAEVPPQFREGVSEILESVDPPKIVVRRKRSWRFWLIIIALIGLVAIVLMRFLGS